ncbi:extracellular solute-binding protein [Deinococcus psychrotolerans]|uniref:Extracellular solute-binding protein n=1 Tax=Deinococcus psychrotolerans TaxID=2489213 RepID=A0A3G8YRE3_9DEIO|nr:extracellular solute-binding protein [Deinococcus psychrotolerans]AZI44321.1 extracellular solute-binding protein [Deinococcus psychrotolerans]
MKHLACAALTLALLSSAQAVTLTHWEHQYAPRAAVLKDMIAAYQKSSGDSVTFEAIPYDSYFDKLTTALSSNNGPDIFKVPSTMSYQFIKAGLAAPAPTNLYTAAQAKKDYLTWAVNPAVQNNQLYGLPTDVQTVVMYINNDLVKACGGNAAQPPRTWAAFTKLAQACTKRDASGKMTQAGVDTRYKWALFTTFLYQGTGGKVVSPAAKKALWDSAGGMKSWNLMQTLFSGSQAVDLPTFMTGQFKFELGKAAFYFNHPTTRSRLSDMSPDLKYTIALPPSPDGKPSTIASSWVYMVNARSKNVDAAWKWIMYISSEASQRQWVKDGGDLPGLKKLVNDPALFPDANAKVVQQSLKYVYTPQEVGGDPVDAIRQEIWDKLVLTSDAKIDLAALVKQQSGAETQLIQSILK